LEKVAYLVDPLQSDCKGRQSDQKEEPVTNTFAPVCDMFSGLFLKPSKKAKLGPLGKGWEGLLGCPNAISTEEWQNLFLNSNVIIYTGFNQIFENLRAQFFARISLSTTSLALVYDQIVKANGVHEIAPKVEGVFPPLTASYQTALLFTLRGAGTIGVQLYSSTPPCSLFSLIELIDSNKTVSEALALQRSSKLKKSTIKEGLFLQASGAAPQAPQLPFVPLGFDLSAFSMALYGLQATRLPKKKE
jgi:hypothetical protein